MKSHFSHFLHHTLSHSDVNAVSTPSLSHSDVNAVSTPSLSHSGLTGVSRSNKVANLFHLDYRVKPDNDSICAGRSMVEMLGVLAIIGVLSVGAIAGYSKAMMKYKLNKQAEQISWLLNVMYRHRLSFGRGPQAMSLTPYFIKLGEIPQEMIKDGSGYLYDRFGAKIALQTNDCENNICQSIILRYHTSSSENFAVCQNLLTVAKEFHNDIHSTGVYKNTNDTDNYGNSYYGDKKCTNNCIRNITQEQIYNQCKYCDEGSTGCHLYFIFRIE